ncbi:MAG TPA: class I SAM-dependent methyltransferase [Solirubrobacteraceae bacterium]
MTPTLIAPARDAYDALAPVYDVLTARYAYDRWLAALEDLALEHGLSGHRVLDVACGTGKSFLPLLERGWEVTACDISDEMAARAAAKAAGRADVHVADMRELPVYGEFDLITCLDDAINHLLEPDDVIDALAGMRENLAPAGLIAFDVNTPVAYRSAAADAVIEDDDSLAVWRGSGGRLAAPGGEVEVVVEVFTRADGDLWARRRSRQRHRHYPLAELCELVEAAGLRVVALRGQWPGAVLDADVDEERHPKAVFLARKGGLT